MTVGAIRIIVSPNDPIVTVECDGQPKFDTTKEELIRFCKAIVDHPEVFSFRKKENT